MIEHQLLEATLAADRFSAEGKVHRLKLLKAVADPTRLAILDRLAGCGERCHCDLESDLDVPASRMSFHLKVLREAGIVESFRQGKRVSYRLTERALERIHAALPTASVGCELICVPIGDAVDGGR
ncbi:MAG: ArsR family transcriptional regulator [Nitriliruptor sp.]|nr:MAG: ArsR family transcriptional regulator [Nitriliruptor sp.]TVR19896.1 MAG: ArsR family transcriptional regulator [Nitriliruptor sp.]